MNFYACKLIFWIIIPVESAHSSKPSLILIKLLHVLLQPFNSLTQEPLFLIMPMSSFIHSFNEA